MKIISKVVKECDNSNGDKTKVLELKYTHRNLPGTILVRDFIEDDYQLVLKQIRKAVRENYEEYNKSLCENSSSKK